MIKPKFLLSLLLFMYTVAANAGCGGPYIDFYRLHEPFGSFGRLFWMDNKAHEFTFNVADTFGIVTGAYSCDDAITTQVYRNDTLIASPNSRSYLLVCKPGKYKFFVFSPHLMGNPGAINFTIVNPATLVGISELQKNFDRFSILPNPAKESVTIYLPDGSFKSVSLLDVYSKVLWQETISGQKTNVPLSHFPPGIYFIRAVTYNEETSIKKLIIQ